ncbi:MAG: hypothetical protein LJE89_10640 [Deltaproteobacteria bacterium]|nr:hypothetical protein [Deltaproteobacteria bacterium]
MLKGKMLDCSWKEFEELIKKAIGSDFLWKIRPRDTQVNRQTVMESIETMVGNNNGSFPDGGNIFIEPEKTKAVTPEGGTL